MNSSESLDGSIDIQRLHNVSSGQSPRSNFGAFRSGNVIWGFGLAMLSVRFVQGFIYWGGGSRRFFYAPSKLDPNAPHWMAYKFQTAMPGALLGMDHVISYMLQHFYLLYAGVILFSAAELIVGLMLMAGLMTRAAALASMGFSVLLMLMFGWQGATCIDEWTMASCNLAMGATLLLAGAGAYSLDNRLLARRPELAQKRWFRLASGALPLDIEPRRFRTIGLVIFALVAAFVVGTYDYYRGSVISPFHSGPVSPTVHHLALDDGKLNGDGSISMHAYLDGGTPEAPIYIVSASVLDAAKKPIGGWDAKTLSALPKSDFANDYAYNKFGPGAFGIKAPMGAAATITLPRPAALNSASPAFVRLTDVAGKSFTTAIQG